MTRHPRIPAYIWGAWAAARRREDYPAALNGYDRQPFYRAGRLSKIELEPDHRRPLTDDEIALLDRIAWAVGQLRVRRPAEILALEVHEGAYLGAGPDREARYEQMRIAPDSCRRMAGRARRAVEDLLRG